MRVPFLNPFQRDALNKSELTAGKWSPVGSLLHIPFLFGTFWLSISTVPYTFHIKNFWFLKPKTCGKSTSEDWCSQPGNNPICLTFKRKLSSFSWEEFSPSKMHLDREKRAQRFFVIWNRLSILLFACVWSECYSVLSSKSSFSSMPKTELHPNWFLRFPFAFAEHLWAYCGKWKLEQIPFKGLPFQGPLSLWL